jgi:integrase
VFLRAGFLDIGKVLEVSRWQGKYFSLERGSFMTVFSVSIKKKAKDQVKKVKVWRYDFQIKGQRYQSQDYTTKTAAKEAEDLKRAELTAHPITAPTSITCLELINRRLSYMKVWNGDRHFTDYRYMARRWAKNWGHLPCDQITQNMVRVWIQIRGRKSPHTGNKEIRFLRALFNWGKKQNPPFVKINPVDGIDPLPIKEKFVKYVPPKEDLAKVLWLAGQRGGDLMDYLYALWDTKGRMSEINRLTWEDVKLDEGQAPWKRSHVVLYTRKKKGGNLTPRQVPLTKRLYGILIQRYKDRDKTMQWVFWHEWNDNRSGDLKRGPYKHRRRVMKTLCREAGVKHFEFHALRHLGASIMGNSSKVSIGAIQRILGHESPRTTEIYLHSIGDAERAAMEVFEEESVINTSEEKEGER